VGGGESSEHIKELLKKILWGEKEKAPRESRKKGQEDVFPSSRKRRPFLEGKRSAKTAVTGKYQSRPANHPKRPLRDSREGRPGD